MIILYFFQLILAVIVLSISAQFVVEGVDHFARRLKMSSFSASFFVLGLLTSLPEIGVGVSSLIDKQPDIYVGNLIGASFVLFLLAVPLLAIFGNGIKLSYQLTNANLLFAIFVIMVPCIFISDGAVSNGEAIAMIFLYFLLFIFIESKKKVLSEFKADVKEDIAAPRKHWLLYLVQVIGGCVLIFISSKYLVDTIEHFAILWNAPNYVISLLVLGIGTNLPEFTIAATSIIKMEKEVAFGDYVGSAAANTMVFGVLSLINGPFIIHNGNFFLTFVIFTLGMLAFYHFARSKRDISRKEGFMLLVVYVVFILLELL